MIVETRGIWRIGARILPMLLLAACSSLPSSGPLVIQVHQEAELQQRFPFRIVKLAPELLPAIADGDGLPPDIFIDDAAASGLRIGPGDTLSVTIVEPGSGGLFTAMPQNGIAQFNEAGAKVVTLPEASVNQNGQINIPFAGTLRVSGRSEIEVARQIEGALAGKVVTPQVMVKVTHTDENRFTITGRVKTPGLFQLDEHGLTLLDALALAGGGTDQPEQTLVQLVRSGRVHTVSETALLDSPLLNVHLRPGDKIHVYFDPRQFTVLGATVKSQQQTLPRTKLTLAEALAQSGGLDDRRADSHGLMLFRYERRSTVERIAEIEAKLARRRGEDLSGKLDRHTAALPEEAPVPVIYELNMQSPTGLFMAMQLAVRQKDLVYVANAESVQWQKLLDLLRITYTPVEQGAISARSF